MKAVGVIAEFNPFHRGHARLIQEAKKQSEAGIAVTVMSGWFTQRGEPAVMPPSDRARMALSAGADCVFLLPALWSVRDAEHFALGGVSMLDSLGCDAIAFGAETDDLPMMQSVAALLEEEPAAFREALHGFLGKGLAHPSAVSASVSLMIPGADDLLRRPNNTLAVCYLRALHRLRSGMKPILIRRDSDYHALSLQADDPSASAIRLAMREHRTDEAAAAIPEACRSAFLEAVRLGNTLFPESLDSALRYRLLSMTEDEWRSLPGLSEGLQHRLHSAARACTTREAMLAKCRTKRYPEARIARLMAHVLLRITQSDLDAKPLPTEAILLGLTGNALPFLRRTAEKGFPVCGKASDWIHLSEPWSKAEILAGDLWALGCGLPSGQAVTHPVIHA